MRHPEVRFSGSAYHDSNHGDVPLEHSFRSWNWSRADLGDRTAILYDVRSTDDSLRPWGRMFHRNGQIEEIQPPRHVQLPSTGWRVDRATRCDLNGHARVLDTLEDTPFYSRSLLDTQLHGQRSHAIHESLNLERFTQPWVQFLLPFRIRRGW